MNELQKKLAHLRSSMKESGIDAYIIPSTDPHLGEYVSDNWRIIAWLTGFTGSSATVVITESFAGLWTDSRYFIQAEEQLSGSGFSLVLPDKNGENDYSDWLKFNMSEGGTTGVDGRIFSIGRLRNLEKKLLFKNISIRTECDLISEIWVDRSAIPDSPAFDFPVAFCGKDRSLKISGVREMMKTSGADYHLLSSSDDIMWLLNIRGKDIKHSPLLLSYAIVGEEQILLFTEESKIPFSLAREFDRLGIVILPYEETAGVLSSLPEGLSILITPATTSASLFKAIPEGMRIIENTSIPSRLKSVKNRTEIENIGKAMVKDGIALTRFFFWFEQNRGSVSMTELSLAEMLISLRAEQEHFQGPSFTPIVAWNENGALPHYSATPESDSLIEGSGLLLIDSGGQYFEGTTDITRTIAVGSPTVNQAKDFTLVLKGHIALALASFPARTKGVQLDILARKPLWGNGLNYGHGTGHGVGFFLNVHEGPVSISPSTGSDVKPEIEPGMLISNEPGIYREGEYGIRTENLILCFEDKETEFGKFLRFDTVSLCYIDKHLIERSLLNADEIVWLNRYHSEVYEKISPHLTAEGKEWLKKKTSSI